MPDPDAIDVQSLRKEFGAKVAVADLTLSVRKGEVFGFLGPNGAGKTTSIKMLLGLVHPTDGSGNVLGKPLGDVTARAKIGFLPEHFRFQDWLSGREFLRFHGRLYGLHGASLDDRIETLLQRVDLLDAGPRAIRDYSKGMLQRIGLAQALLNHPQLVFLDEPTSGLDPLGRLLVRDILNELRAEGVAVFLNSHLLSEIEVVCDRVVFIRRGIVVRELAMHDWQDSVCISVRVGADQLTPALWQGFSQFGTITLQPNHTAQIQVTGEEQLPHIARWLTGQGVDLYHLAAERQSLESLFLETMGDEERPG